jgi:tight adherence protein C
MIESILFGFVLTLGSLSLISFLRSIQPISLLERVTLTEPQGPDYSSFRKYLREIFQFRSKRSKRHTGVLYELPDFINLLGVGIAAGESLHSSLSFVTSRASGQVATEFRTLLKALELGSSLEHELKQLSDRFPQTQMAELCNKMSISLRRGTSLSHLLSEQAQSIRSEIQIQRVKQAGKNETRMMVPLVFLILPITVIFAIFPSLSLLNIEII